MLFAGLKTELNDHFDIQMSDVQQDNIIDIMTNEFPVGAGKNTYAECILAEKDAEPSKDYYVSKSFSEMLANKEFYEILKELVEI